MTTAKHCMYLTKCCELLAWQCMSLYGYGELNIMQRTYSFVDYYNYDVSNLQGLEPASFKFYQNSNWSLHHSESEGLEETQAEAKTQSLPIGTEVRKSWKRRWFVLDLKKGCVAYFENHISDHPKGVFRCLTISRVYAHPQQHKCPNLFSIETFDRKYQVEAPNILAMEVWLTCLSVPLIAWTN